MQPLPKTPSLDNNKSCTKIEVPPPAGGKIAVIKEIINKNPGIPTPGPFYVNLVCKPSGPSTSITLTGSNLSQVVNVPVGSTCHIEEKPPVAPRGCKWSTTYPNGQTGKPGDKMVVQNELICEPKSCPAGQIESTFPGSTVKYCCDGKPGSDKFCCSKKN